MGGREEEGAEKKNRERLEGKRLRDPHPSTQPPRLLDPVGLEPRAQVCSASCRKGTVGSRITREAIASVVWAALHKPFLNIHDLAQWNKENVKPTLSVLLHCSPNLKL